LGFSHRQDPMVRKGRRGDTVATGLSQCQTVGASVGMACKLPLIDK
jgi:hypothetical protein